MRIFSTLFFVFLFSFLRLPSFPPSILSFLSFFFFSWRTAGAGNGTGWKMALNQTSCTPLLHLPLYHSKDKTPSLGSLKYQHRNPFRRWWDPGMRPGEGSASPKDATNFPQHLKCTSSGPRARELLFKMKRKITVTYPWWQFERWNFHFECQCVPMEKLLDSNTAQC